MVLGVIAVALVPVVEHSGIGDFLLKSLVRDYLIRIWTRFVHFLDANSYETA